MDTLYAEEKWVRNFNKSNVKESTSTKKGGEDQDDLEAYGVPGVEVGWEDTRKDKGNNL